MSLVVITIQSDPADDQQVSISAVAEPNLPIGEPQEVDAVQAVAIEMLNAVQGRNKEPGERVAN